MKKLQLKKQWFNFDRLLAIGFFLAILIASIQSLYTQDIKTDPVSEKIVLTDAKDILAGNHRWGIGLTTQYKHYPNGPAYILIPFLALGVSSKFALRLIPIIFSSLSFSVFYFWVIKEFKNLSHKLVLTLALMLLIFQPGILYWTKALHEHAYALALMPLVLIAAAKPKSGFWLVLIGFINGWIGYDFIPSQTVALSAAILLKTALEGKSKSWSVILRNTVKKLWPFIGGTLASILLHFVQNSLYYSSINLAFNDLFGSFFVRLGAQGLGEKYSPQYYTHIKDAFGQKALASRNNFLLSRLDIVLRFLRFPPKMTLRPLIFAVLNIILLYLLGKIFRELKSKIKRSVFIASVIIGGLSGITWHLLMAWHAHFHFFFVYRHAFLVQFTWLALIRIYQASKAKA